MSVHITDVRLAAFEIARSIFRPSVLTFLQFVVSYCACSYLTYFLPKENTKSSPEDNHTLPIPGYIKFCLQHTCLNGARVLFDGPASRETDILCIYISFWKSLTLDLADTTKT